MVMMGATRSKSVSALLGKGGDGGGSGGGQLVGDSTDFLYRPPPTLPSVASRPLSADDGMPDVRAIPTGAVPCCAAMSTACSARGVLHVPAWPPYLPVCVQKRSRRACLYRSRWPSRRAR
jgi:hypothetical protein